ncbi:Protein FAR1-RELATED SEQUENCE 5 [Striga hermonthica]|uniref:Protein FAR1-RELATED SEQUENCE 5 n=1 Tax=Striga hermonthica TaxID=68872 RepID=A0A9N7NQH6_STRHE|nr:Protein FAR1-RELATED SEQUENCE 5 [Striga hermonthica]
MDKSKSAPSRRLDFEFDDYSSYYFPIENGENRDKQYDFLSVDGEDGDGHYDFKYSENPASEGNRDGQLEPRHAEKPTVERKSVGLEAKTPLLGMKFESEEDAYLFYNEYASLAGFSIRRHTAHKNKDGKILDRVFCCACQGKKEQDKRVVNVKFHHIEIRTGCGALMKISSRRSGKYEIVKFVSDHSGHGLVSPNKCHMLRSHRHITAAQAAQIESIDISGIPPKAGLDYMARQAGGRENVGFIMEDYKNYLRTKRTVEMRVGDTGGVLEYLQQKQVEDPNFFHAIQVDSDDMITNVFWADGQMMVDYMHFGDVVCFDTTYRKNKEGRPFALFVGVNHHKQTIIFGAALLYDETAQTFMWLFDTFAKTMSARVSGELPFSASSFPTNQQLRRVAPTRPSSFTLPATEQSRPGDQHSSDPNQLKNQAQHHFRPTSSSDPPQTRVQQSRYVRTDPVCCHSPKNPLLDTPAQPVAQVAPLARQPAAIQPALPAPPQQAQHRHKRKWRGHDDKRNRRPGAPAQAAPPVLQPPAICATCQRAHRGECLAGQDICYRCRMPGHRIADCPDRPQP